MLNNDLETIELQLFLEALHLRYGYDFEHCARGSLRRIVRRQLVQQGCAHISDLTSRALHDEVLAGKLGLEVHTALHLPPPDADWLRLRAAWANLSKEQRTAFATEIEQAAAMDQAYLGKIDSNRND